MIYLYYSNFKNGIQSLWRKQGVSGPLDNTGGAQVRLFCYLPNGSGGFPLRAVPGKCEAERLAPTIQQRLIPLGIGAFIPPHTSRVCRQSPCWVWTFIAQNERSYHDSEKGGYKALYSRDLELSVGYNLASEANLTVLSA